MDRERVHFQAVARKMMEDRFEAANKKKPAGIHVEFKPGDTPSRPLED